MMIKKCGLCVLMVLMSGLTWAESLRVDSVDWRAPIPGQSVAAVYLTLTNESDVPMTLVGVNVDWARKAEFHTHTHEQGMMRMRKLERLELVAGEEVKMASGGVHIMVFGVEGGVKNDRALDLLLASGKKVTVNIPSDDR